jgi:hypothetical protein
MSLTSDQLARLDLSDEAREVLQRDIDENKRRDAELKRYRDETKEAGVTTRLTQLSEMGFKDCPGFLQVVEDVLRSDDGDVAEKLHLSETGVTEHKTVTQIVDLIIDAFPKTKEGKIALSEKANLLESPLTGRPNLEPDKNDEDAPATGTELAEKWAKDLGGSLNLDLAPVGGKE